MSAASKSYAKISYYVFHAFPLAFYELCKCLCTTTKAHIEKWAFPSNSHIMIVFISTLAINIWWHFAPFKVMRFDLCPSLKPDNFPFQNEPNNHKTNKLILSWILFSSVWPRQGCVRKHEIERWLSHVLLFCRTEIKVHQQGFSFSSYSMMNDSHSNVFPLAQA